MKIIKIEKCQRRGWGSKKKNWKMSGMDKQKIHTDCNEWALSS